MSNDRYSSPVELPWFLYPEHISCEVDPIFLFRLKEGDPRIRSVDQMPLIAAGGQACLPPSYPGKSLARVLKDSRAESVGKLWLWAWMRHEYEGSLPPDEGGYSTPFALASLFEQCIATDLKRKYRLPSFLYGLLCEVEEVLCEAIYHSEGAIDIPCSIAKMTPETFNQHMNTLFAATDARQQWLALNAFEKSLVRRGGKDD